MALLTTKVIVSSLAAIALAVAGSSLFPKEEVTLTSAHPGTILTLDTLDDSQLVPAAKAAKCAGFPEGIVTSINRAYSPSDQVVFDSLPPNYDIKRVMITVATGACEMQTPEDLPVIGPGQALRLLHAIGIVDLNDVKGEGLTFYVVVELEGGTSSATERTFMAVRLPAPDLPEQSEHSGTIA